MDSLASIKIEDNNLEFQNKFSTKEEKINVNEHDMKLKVGLYEENDEVTIPSFHTVLIKYEEDFTFIKDEIEEESCDPLDTDGTQCIDAAFTLEDNICTNIHDNVCRNTPSENVYTGGSSVETALLDVARPIECNDERQVKALKTCKTCGCLTNSKTHFIKHIKVPAFCNQKSFKCTFCKYSTSQKFNMNKHMKLHTEKPFKCTVCEFSARSKYQIDLHMRRIHTKEKPFKCTVCEFSACRKSNMDIHMRIHTSEKLFKCTVCEYSASYKSTINKHMKIHTDE